MIDLYIHMYIISYHIVDWKSEPWSPISLGKIGFYPYDIV